MENLRSNFGAYIIGDEVEIQPGGISQSFWVTLTAVDGTQLTGSAFGECPDPIWHGDVFRFGKDEVILRGQEYFDRTHRQIGRAVFEGRYPGILQGVEGTVVSESLRQLGYEVVEKMIRQDE